MAKYGKLGEVNPVVTPIWLSGIFPEGIQQSGIDKNHATTAKVAERRQER
jgi:hypothetical protein